MKHINMRISSFVVLALTVLFSSSCIPRQIAQTSFPSRLTVEEHPLQHAPTADPFSFTPQRGTQEEILAKHQLERGMPFPDNSIIFEGQPAFSVRLGNEDLVAFESYTDAVTNLGTFQKVMVQVSKNGQEIFSAAAGDVSPINNLRGLWTYSDYWVLEIAHVNLDMSSNEIPLETIGQIIQDGESLNDRYGYDQAFGFQLIKSKPFFFFQKDGKFGISYDGQQVSPGYTQIPHYLCCSEAQLNPRIAQNMVAFFAQRQGKWYYVEIGAFE